MKPIFSRSAYLVLAVVLLAGCGGGGDESEDSGESSGGNYLSCVLEYTEAVRAGILDATSEEITQECLTQYSP